MLTAHLSISFGNTCSEYISIDPASPDAGAVLGFISIWRPLSNLNGKRPRGLDPIPCALLRIGVPGNVGDDRRAIRSGLKHSRDPGERDPPDRNEGYLTDFLLPFREARQALRREGHGF